MYLRFRSGGNGNSNARVLNTILKKNTVIEEVDLSFTGLDDEGIEEVRRGLIITSQMLSLNMSVSEYAILCYAMLCYAMLSSVHHFR